MANEIQVSANLTYAKGGMASESLVTTGQNVTWTGTRSIKRTFTVNNSDTTIPLPEGTLGLAMFKNLDATNTINIKTASGGTVIVSLQPGECALFRFGSGVTAPVAISSAGTPEMEYAILEA